MDPLLNGTNGCSIGTNGDEVSGANDCVPLATIDSIIMDPMEQLGGDIFFTKHLDLMQSSPLWVAYSQNTLPYHFENFYGL